jgi:hypothetical protein
MRLLSLKSGPEILKLLKSLDQESKAIIEDIATLALYSNQSYNELWHMTYEERKIFSSVLQTKIKLDKGLKPQQELKQELI